jgi:hypothetical protein
MFETNVLTGKPEFASGLLCAADGKEARHFRVFASAVEVSKFVGKYR